MSDEITYTNSIQASTERMFGDHVGSHDNHGNEAYGPTIVCASGEVIERSEDEFRSDARAIAAIGKGEGIIANPLNGYSFDLGNLPSPLQTRCQAATGQAQDLPARP